jgi:hypothetical protein
MKSDVRRPEPDSAKARRGKLIGRLLIVGMGLLVLAYLIPTLLNIRR